MPARKCHPAWGASMASMKFSSPPARPPGNVRRQLMEALPPPASRGRLSYQALDFFGVGGERMRAAGCETVVDAKDLAVVGITEILSHLPKILGLYKHLIAEADRRKPDLAIVIDSPAFNWRVARQMKKRGIPTVYYVAPQFWAWRQGRVRLIRDYINKALVIFPFEEKFYRDHGVDASFVGHPLAELPDPSIERADYARQFQLDADKQWIALMPGSRVKEVRMNLPTILESVALLGPDTNTCFRSRPHWTAACWKRWCEGRRSRSCQMPCLPCFTPARGSSPAAQQRWRPR